MDLVHDRGSMDPVHESGPWTRSKEGVHGPQVHVLSSPIEYSSLKCHPSLRLTPQPAEDVVSFAAPLGRMTDDMSD